MELNDIYDYLIENEIVNTWELDLVTNVAGFNLETLEAVIYARTGFNDIEQLQEELEGK
jgi:hypothetical protein